MLCNKRLPLLRYLLLLLWLWMLTLTSWLERSSFLFPTLLLHKQQHFHFFFPLQRTRNECWYCRTSPFLIIKLAIVVCVNTGSHLDWFISLVYIIARFTVLVIFLKHFTPELFIYTLYIYWPHKIGFFFYFTLKSVCDSVLFFWRTIIFGRDLPYCNQATVWTRWKVRFWIWQYIFFNFHGQKCCYNDEILF